MNTIRARCAPLAIAVAALTVAGVGYAEDPLPCMPPGAPGTVPVCCLAKNHSNGKDCENVRTYLPSATDQFIPNHWLHLTPHLDASFNWDATLGTFQYVPGGGVYFGVAPARDQLLRVSAALDLAFPQATSSIHTTAWIEPGARVSFGDLNRPLLPMDIFINGFAPYDVHSGKWGWGLGGGLTFRPLNAFAVDVGYNFLRNPDNGGVGPDRFTHQLRITIGFDFLWFTSGPAKPVTRQTVIDLRCALFETARVIRQTSPGGPQTYCPGVMQTLINYRTGKDERGDDQLATNAFLRALKGDIQATLLTHHRKLEQCNAQIRNVQRRCVDCSAEVLREWTSYAIDPHQIAAALGCVEGEQADEVACEPADARVASLFAAGCGGLP